jgi:hypothetical protein
MAFQLSPGVLVKETDLTSVVPSVATTTGAFVGDFAWGPANEITTISSENDLVARFGKPNDTTAKDFLTAASFLAYGNNLKTVRSLDDTTAKNAVQSGTAVLISNSEDYFNNHSTGSGTNGMWAAKYAGALGNSLRVSFADSSNFDTNSVASVTVSAGGSSYTSAPSVSFTAPGAGVTATGTATVSGGAVTAITITNPGNGYEALPTISITGGGGTGATATAVLATDWNYKNEFDQAPLTSIDVLQAGGSNDQMHVIVVDEDGLFTGTIGTVLERFESVSKASDAKALEGGSLFYKDVINSQSKYIYWTDHPAGDATWGTAKTGTAYTSGFTTAEGYCSLTGGVSDSPDSSDIQTSWNLFADAEQTDVSLLITGSINTTDQKFVQDNIAKVRKDCISFHSPQFASCVNNSGSEETAITTDKGLLAATSYSFMDSNWKYMYDRYNDVYRWVPLNGDTAGLCVATDLDREAWYSPAGFNRGQIRNAVKLAWSPNKANRDNLYKIGVNPIINSPGNGIILFGDKTLLSQPSAFDRINVRRLFIVLEKAIATSAKYQLFEFNDSFTRNQFVNIVKPFLRNVQGGRGIHDFKVVCDESNNTGQVIDSNQFVADIFIKPTRSINFITLNFIATRTGVEFEEVGA